MNTKINKNTSDNKALLGIYGAISEEEHNSFTQFFSFRGMKTAFARERCPEDVKLGSFKRKLDYALSNKYYNSNILKSIREFVEEHKQEVELFIKQDNG